MEVAIVAPIKLLDKYCITHVQYCFPRLLVDSKEYRSFYVARQELGNTMILDCRRITWKRSPEFLPVVQEALQHIQPDWVVLPSVMYNVPETFIVAKKYLKALPKNLSFIGCLEGTTIKEVQKCKRQLSKLGLINFAIPAPLYSTYKNEEAMYLGLQTTPEELVGYSGILITSLPVRLGLQGRFLIDYLPSPPPLTFYETADPYPETTKSNIEEVLALYET